MRHLGRGLDVPAQAGDDAGEDHHQAVCAGVDDAGLAEHLELLRGAGDGLLAVAHGVLQQLGEQRILLRGRGVGREADLLHVGEPPRDRVRHLAEDGQHRALGRLPDRFVRRVGGPGERRRDQHRIDQLARPAGELLGGAANDLAEDHPGVSAGPHQSGSRERVDQFGAPHLINHLSIEAIELLADGAQGEGHVVAGIAVGDGEHVEVVDLLAPLLEVGGGRADHAAESLYGGVCHAGSDGTLDPGGAFASVPRRPW